MHISTPDLAQDTEEKIILETPLLQQHTYTPVSSEELILKFLNLPEGYEHEQQGGRHRTYKHRHLTDADWEMVMEEDAGGMAYAKKFHQLTQYFLSSEHQIPEEERELLLTVGLTHDWIQGVMSLPKGKGKEGEEAALSFLLKKIIRENGKPSLYEGIHQLMTNTEHSLYQHFTLIKHLDQLDTGIHAWKQTRQDYQEQHQWSKAQEDCTKNRLYWLTCNEITQALPLLCEASAHIASIKEFLTTHEHTIDEILNTMPNTAFLMAGEKGPTLKASFVHTMHTFSTWKSVS